MPLGRNALLYNSNGFAFHRLEDAARVLAALGYDGLALTPDVHHLDPFRAPKADVLAFRRLLADLRLSVVIETGARFVLDPARKHRPTLLDDEPGAGRRLDFLRRCVDLASDLEAPLVSTWSGSPPPGASPALAHERLVAGLSRLCEHARGRGVRIGFEPEPGMAVETVEGWTNVRDDVGSPVLGLAFDVGHALATGEGDPASIVRRHAKEIVVLQLDDHVRGRHDHKMFGEGDVAWPALATAVRESGYVGPLEVELSRHSSEAPEAARKSIEFLRALPW